MKSGDINILDEVIEGSAHVVPLNDLIEHVPDGSCCYPVIHEGQAVHSAKDCRESFERATGRGKKNKPWANYIVHNGEFVNQDKYYGQE